MHKYHSILTVRNILSFSSSSTSSSNSSSSTSTDHPNKRPAVHEIYDKNEPYVYSHEGIRVTVEANQKYKWCACGLSQTQPWCDNSHHRYGMTIRPVHYSPTKSGTVNLCGCKYSRRRPFCDGAHSFLHPPGTGAKNKDAL